MTGELVIETEGLTKRFGSVTAVDDLSMEVRRGHIYGLLGPNGSGKTTTMGMLLGVLRPTAGSFRLFGSTARHEESLRRVGAVIESPGILSLHVGAAEPRILPVHLRTRLAGRRRRRARKGGTGGGGATTSSAPTRLG